MRAFSSQFQENIRDIERSAIIVRRVRVAMRGGPNGRKVSRILLPADNHSNESSGIEASRAGIAYTACSEGEHRGILTDFM